MKGLKRTHTHLRRIARILAGLVLLFVLLVLFIRSQWGQQKIVNELIAYVKERTGTRITLDKVYLTFSGNVAIESLYLEDLNRDTLLYSRSLEANIGFGSLFFGNSLELESVEWDGALINIQRVETEEKFNFDFLMEAFTDANTPPVETEEKVLDLKIGTLILKNIRANYKDAFLGIHSRNQIGSLKVKVDAIDLEELHFQIAEVRLANTTLFFQQNKVFPETETVSDNPLPLLGLQDVILEELSVSYQSIPDGLQATTHIKKLATSLPKIDLVNSNFSIAGLSLQQSDINLEMTERESEKKEVPTATTSFNWPDLAVNVNAISLEDNQFSLVLISVDSLGQKNGLSNWSFSEIDLTTPNISYRPGNANWDIEQVSFREQSGFQLKSFTTKGSMTERKLQISELDVAANNSLLNGQMELSYASVEQLIQAPENTNFRLALPSYRIALEDALFFQNEFKNDSLMQSISTHPITGQLLVEGRPDAFRLSNTEARWGSLTTLQLSGIVYDVLTSDSLRLGIDTMEARTGKADLALLNILPDTVVRVPKEIRLNGMVTGTLDNFETELRLTSTLGNASYKGEAGFSATPFLDGSFKIDDLQLDSLLQNPSLGNTNMSGNIALHGTGINDLKCDFDAVAQQLIVNDYTYEKLKLSGTLNNGLGTIGLDYHDENLHFDAGAELRLSEFDYQINSSIQLIGADLQALRLTSTNLKVGATLETTFESNRNGFALNGLLSEVVAVSKNRQYQTSDIKVTSTIDSMTTRAGIESSFLNGDFIANGNLNAITAALSAQWNRYFNDVSITKPYQDTLSIEMNAQLAPEPILTEVFLKGAERFDTIAMNVKFKAMDRSLHAELHAPFLHYNGTTIDSLHLNIDGDAENFNFTSGIASIQNGPIQVQRTLFEGTLEKEELLLDFSAYDETEKLAHISSEMRWKDGMLSLHINPKNLVLNRVSWSVPAKNKLILSTNSVDFRDFTFSNGDQQFTLSDSVAGKEGDHLGLLFKNFELQTFTSLLNPNDTLVSGRAQGSIVLDNPFEASGLLAALDIGDLGVMENRLGNLSLTASSQGFSSYDLDLAIVDGGLELELGGQYVSRTETTDLDFDLDLKKLETQIITKFFDTELQAPKGYLSGGFDLGGTLAAPSFDGRVSFHETSVELAPLNMQFTVTDEIIRVNEESLILDNFLISDAQGNSFIIDGDIGVSEFTNPTFDLRLNAEEFRLLNATKEDNELYYGVASIDADVNLKGNALLPKVNGKVRVRKLTELTYVIPEERLDIEERDGVVIFVNKENSDAILTRQESESAPDLFLGADINIALELAEDANFTIVLDEKTGDMLQVAGDAALNLNIDPNGTVGLTGRYELKKGFYRTSLYNLVNRKFDLQPGSTITWQGDPMDAKLDVTAIYRLETSAAPLMASATSGVASSLASQYQQVMPFLVYLNVDGELLAPQLSFDLGIPENARGDLGGAVYGKVQQLNEQETELNKQVFSLLALNRFFPNTTSDGSNGGAAGLARNNVNKVLSGELNAFSEKLFDDSGFDLNFDLDSFTDYTGDDAQDRTQLNINAQKKLFNDRLIVTAGSAIDVEGSAQAGQEETPIIGNVSLEYLLTKNGRYRLKGFRKNEYVNVIDGQLILTGLAFIFNRDFNEFSELFNPMTELEREDALQKGTSKIKPQKKRHGN